MQLLLISIRIGIVAW